MTDNRYCLHHSGEPRRDPEHPSMRGPKPDKVIVDEPDDEPDPEPTLS